MARGRALRSEKAAAVTPERTALLSERKLACVMPAAFPSTTDQCRLSLARSARDLGDRSMRCASPAPKMGRGRCGDEGSVVAPSRRTRIAPGMTRRGRVREIAVPSTSRPAHRGRRAPRDVAADLSQSRASRLGSPATARRIVRGMAPSAAEGRARTRPPFCGPARLSVCSGVHEASQSVGAQEVVPKVSSRQRRPGDRRA